MHSILRKQTHNEIIITHYLLQIHNAESLRNRFHFDSRFV